MPATGVQSNRNRAGNGAMTQIQRIGGFLYAMIMPGIGAFAAWGLIAAPSF